MAESQTLYTQIIAGADDAVARKRRIDKQLDDITPDLKKAIAQSDTLTADTGAAALGRVEEEIQDALEFIRQVVSKLNELNKDKAFVSQRMLVLGTAARALSTTRDALTEASERAHALIDQAEDLKKHSHVSNAAAQRGLAQLRMWLRNDENAAKETHTKADQIVAATQAAVEQRDDAALATQQKAFDLLSIGVRQEDPKRNRDNIAAWARRTIGKGLPPGIDTDLAREVKELYAKVDEFEKHWIAPLARLEAKVMAAVVPDIDARKAATELKLEPTFTARLGKVLNDTPLAKLEAALESFRKANKLPGSGREMLMGLRRAKLLR
jgi:hypothetical protein